MIRLRYAVRLVRPQYECRYDCGFLKPVELTVTGRESNDFLLGAGPHTGSPTTRHCHWQWVNASGRV